MTYGGLGAGGGGGAEDERLSEDSTANTDGPRKNGEIVDRRQNDGSCVPRHHCGGAADSAVHNSVSAVPTAVLGRVTRTMSVALLLRNQRLILCIQLS